MQINKVFEFIKADRFFPAYLPHIKDYKRKISGRNGRGNPLDFSDVEKKEIKAAIKKLLQDIAR